MERSAIWMEMSLLTLHGRRYVNQLQFDLTKHLTYPIESDLPLWLLLVSKTDIFWYFAISVSLILFYFNIPRSYLLMSWISCYIILSQTNSFVCVDLPIILTTTTKKHSMVSSRNLPQLLFCYRFVVLYHKKKGAVPGAATQLSGLPPCGSEAPAQEKCMSSYWWKNHIQSEWTSEFSLI